MSRAAAQTGVLTPGRETYLRLDAAQWHVRQPAVGVARRGGEMVDARPVDDYNPRVAQTSVGDWYVTPYTHYLSELRERGDPHSCIVRLSAWTTAPPVNLRPRWTEAATWHKPDLDGVTYDALVADEGDWFIAKTAGWSSGCDMPDDADAFPPPDAGLTQPAADLERVMVSKETYDDDQGFLLRIVSHDAIQAGTGTFARFYWGGSAGLTADGHGIYCLALTGDGYAILYERAIVSTSWEWSKVASFQWAEPTSINARHHWLHILPVPAPTPYIEFLAGVGSRARPANYRSGADLAHQRPAATNACVHWCRGPAAKQRHATAAGAIRWDIRRDCNPHIQTAIMKFRASAYLHDAPVRIPFDPLIANTLAVTYKATTPPGTSVTPSLYTEPDLTPATVDSSIPSAVRFRPVARQNLYSVRYTLTATATSTPFLHASDVGAAAVDVLGGAQQVLARDWSRVPTHILASVAVGGGTSDPSMETAQVTLHDIAGDCYRLRDRGQVPISIETMTPTGTPSVLFRGFAVAPERTLRRASPTSRQSALGGDYVVPAVGMWRMLEERPIGSRVTLSIDPTTDPPVPYKVTDAIRAAFGWAGMPAVEVDVPDLPLRLFATPDNDQVIDPLTTVAELVQRLAADYLGGWIVYDANAGAYGMWRLILPTRAPYTPLAEFRTTHPGGGKSRLAANAYGSGVYPILDAEPMVTWWEPPEANYVLVSTDHSLSPNGETPELAQNWAMNPLSYDGLTDASGQTIRTADPTHPDYLGRQVPVYVINPVIAGSTPEETQRAVAWMVRRYYEQTCLARKRCRFCAPLALITNPADKYQRSPRPLRWYDPVLIDGETWLVRSCTIYYDDDRRQLAVYECEYPRV